MNEPMKTYPVMTRDEAMKDMRARIYAEGLSLYDAANKSSQHRRNFQRLLNGSCELSPGMAATIGRLTDTDPMPWMIAYAIHHLERAVIELDKEIANG
jgi:plasmid maintenance system antidote protein VapI